MLGIASFVLLVTFTFIGGAMTTKMAGPYQSLNDCQIEALMLYHKDFATGRFGRPHLKSVHWACVQAVSDEVHFDE